MNVSDYTALVNHPDSVTDGQTDELERIIQDFPYFQSARALHLKGLYNQNSFKYNYTLKIAAAHTSDRSVLFDFITSDNFVAIENEEHDQKLGGLWNVPVIVEVMPDERESTSVIHEEISETIEISHAPEEAEIPPAELPQAPVWQAEPAKPGMIGLGQPLQFTEAEVHSFAEWLQLSQFKPIARVEEMTEPAPETHLEKQKKNDLIDRFIQANPKMPKVQDEPPTESSLPVESPSVESALLMTETLARVYLEQKKYKKAIQAYEILILKYPEKSGFFADRISEIKDLQQNNNL